MINEEMITEASNAMIFAVEKEGSRRIDVIDVVAVYVRRMVMVGEVETAKEFLSRVVEPSFRDLAEVNERRRNQQNVWTDLRVARQIQHFRENL